MQNIRLWLSLPFIPVLLAASSSVAFAWTPAALLNAPNELEVKHGRLFPANGGGFHAAYAAGGMRYRSYQNGFLSPVSAVYSATFSANPRVSQSYDGKIYYTFENWADGGPKTSVSRSTDNGQSWLRFDVSGSPLSAKHPVVLPYGGGSNMLVTWAEVGPKECRFSTYNGSTWSSPSGFGAPIHSEYQSGTACVSPQDGTIWRVYGRDHGGIRWFIRRWNGTSWESEITLSDPQPIDNFPARVNIAANTLGHVAVVWDENSQFLMRVYVPGSGLRPQVLVAGKDVYGGAYVTNIPGTQDFYLVADAYVWRYYGATNTVGPREDLFNSIGMPRGFTPDSSICTGHDGIIYVAFENWNNGKPQWFYTMKSAAPPGPTGTIAGTVRSQHGLPVMGASVGSGVYSAITNASGYYELTGVLAGTHTLAANKQFYTGQTISGVTVAENQTTPLDFTIIANPPGPVSAFSVNPSDGINRLYWTNPTSGNYAATRITFKTTGFPTGPDDGTLLCERSTAAGGQDSFTHGNADNGVTYYYAAFTRDTDNHFSAGVNGSATPRPLTCGEVKHFESNYFVELNGKVVSAIFASDAAIYVQEPDRTSGIRIQHGGSGLAVGDRVNVSGSVQDRVLSNRLAEREIRRATVTKVSGGAAPKPMAMSNLAVGGAAAGELVPGVIDGIGINNIGLLVRITGRITAKVTSYIYIDDGSGVVDPSGRIGVMVRCPNTSIPAVAGDMVTATGVIVGSIATGTETNRRIVQIRDYNDLVNHGSGHSGS